MTQDDTSTKPQSVQVGDKAPEISALNQKGEQVVLSDLLATGTKVLLVFYPKDETPGCTKQLCGIRDTFKEYRDRNVTVLGVNQGTAESHRAFIANQNYPFDILVDEDKTIRQDYGAIGYFFKNVITKRGVFLIDTDQSVMYRHWGQQNNEEIFTFLDSKSDS